MATFSRSSFIPNRITLDADCIKDPVVLQLKQINNNMRKIDAYVVLGLQGKKKLDDDKRKQDLSKKRRDRQLLLEKQKKASPINFIRDRIPKTGFLESIKNFILYTAMGAMVPFAMKNAPKILQAAKLIAPVYTFFENFAGNVLTKFISAVDFGYTVHDKIRDILKKITGEKFEKTFDELEQNLNTFLNLAVVLGLSTVGSGIGKVLPGAKSKTQTPPTGAPSTSPRAQSRPSPVGATSGRFFGKFGRVFSRVPIIGGLINFAVSMMMGEKIGRAAAKAVGATVGAGLGTFIPFPGVGSILGGILGDAVGGALYDTLETFSAKKKYATGGQVGGKKVTRVPRTLKKSKIPRPPKQSRQKTQPGKNVGGEDQIKRLFPESDDENVMSPLRLLKKNAAIMKRGGVLGNLLSSGFEMMALGQRIEKPTLNSFEKYLTYVIDSSIQDQAAVNSKMLASSMFAMADGGVVPVSRTISRPGTTTGSVVAKEIVKSFTAMLNSRSVDIFQNIKRELDLKAPESSISTEPGTGGGIQVTSSSPDFWLLVTAALFENNNSASGYQGAADVAQAIYNRVSLPGWPKTIRDVILQNGQFQPVEDYGGYGEWSKIKDKQSAIAFISKYGYKQEQLEGVAASLLDTKRQNSARTFVGARDNFRAVSYELSHNHLDDSTEQKRFGHVFGMEHRGLNIAAFKGGKLSPAMINQQIVTGQVSQTTLGELPNGQNGRLSDSELMSVGNGFKLWKPAAVSYLRMKEDAAKEGIYFDLRDAYRDLEGQYAMAEKYKNQPGRAARPGFSNHGWGKAIDLYPKSAQQWVLRNGTRYGWIWREFIPREEWHFEYAGGSSVPQISKPKPQTNRRRPFDPANLIPLTEHKPIEQVITSFSITKDGKKFVYTRKRVNNFDVYTRNGKVISEEEYWRESDKKNYGGQVSQVPLKIVTSTQLDKIRLTSEGISTYKSDEESSKIYLQPVLV